MIKQKIFFILLPILLWLNLSVALEPFVVNKIEFRGLQRVSVETASSYLPIHRGQTLTTQKAQAVINALFATHFFESIDLSRSGNTLIINVTELPTIGHIHVFGYEDITKDQIEKVLKNVGLIEGLTFNPSELDRFTSGLKGEYESRGKYNAHLDTKVSPMPRNRVDINIKISEGTTALVRGITFIGNRDIMSHELESVFPIKPYGIISYFTRKDLFSQQKFSDALTALTNFYLDHGYIRIKIISTQISLTPDHKDVYLTIKLDEGPVYTLSGYSFSGQTGALSQQELTQLAHGLVVGGIFSRQAVQDTSKSISNALGDKGYAFATVNPVPNIDDTKRQVAITYYINPNHLIYVRRINFIGNTKTEDIVLRHQMRQPEGGLISVSNIEESTHRLNLLGYLENVQVETKPVPGSQDQVDINYHVQETPSAQAAISAGYGTNGVVFNAGINQNDFLGTGKFLGLNFSTSTLGQNYSISYNNPYYTKDGIQRGFNLFYTRYTPANLNTMNFVTNTYGGNVNYIIPISAKNDTITTGFGLQNTQLKIFNNPSTQALQFVQQNGNYFNQTMFNAGWSRNGYDKAYFPTKGLYQTASLDLSAPFLGPTSDNLNYYKISYHGHIYQPLGPYFVGSVLGNIAFGDGYGGTGQLPFFQNYYAGGIGSGFIGQVRGYETNTLGPQDSQGKPLGGNALLTGSVGLIFPNPVNKLRTSIFVDTGNVYDTYSGNLSLLQLRTSAGLAGEWQVPVFNLLLDVSVALPIAPRPQDQTQPVQFAIGTNLY